MRTRRCGACGSPRHADDGAVCARCGSALLETTGGDGDGGVLATRPSSVVWARAGVLVTALATLALAALLVVLTVRGHGLGR
jgi:hypothetical protein